MHRPTITKPVRRRSADLIEAYQCETMVIDANTPAVDACGSCHNLATTHSGSSATLGVGVGVNIPGASISATVNHDGSVTSSGQIGVGLVVNSSSTWGATGPKIVVATSGTSLSTPQRSVTTTSTSDAKQDNTRTN